MSGEFKFTLIGHDAEFIVRDNLTKEPISMAKTIRETLDTCCVYPDNVLLEMNTDPVTLDEFPELIKDNLEDLNDYLQSIDAFTNIGESSALYPQDELCSKEAHAIGCQPFFSAEKLGINLTPQPYEDNWRFAGGHIHLAYDKNIIPVHILVRMLDKKLKDNDLQDERRDVFYGQRGAYRNKPYGVEYRALTNHWMLNPEKLVKALKEVEADINERLKLGA